MNDIEYRLRDAFRADAETIGPDQLRALPGRERPVGPLDAPLVDRRPVRFGVPLAAAAAVAAIAAASVLLPGIWSAGHSARPASPGPLARVYPSGKLPDTRPPRFYAAVIGRQDSQGSAGLEVVSTASGRVVGRLPLVDGHVPVAVAAFGPRGEFVIEAVTRGECSMWFYQFRLTSTGVPADVRPLPVAKVAGQPMPFTEQQPFAASANGSIVAFATSPCPPARRTSTAHSTGLSSADRGTVGVINVASGTATTWSIASASFLWGPASLSVSADGRLLGILSVPGTDRLVGTSRWAGAWVVPTNSRPGPLAQRWHRVPVRHRVVSEVAHSPNSVVMVALTPASAPHGGSFPMRIMVYPASTIEKRLSMSDILVLLTRPVISLDESGRYLLMAGWYTPTRTVHAADELDLVTGQFVPLPGSAALNAVSVAW